MEAWCTLKHVLRNVVTTADGIFKDDSNVKKQLFFWREVVTHLRASLAPY